MATQVMFTCPDCQKQFASAAGLRGHQNKVGHKGSALIPKGDKVNMPDAETKPTAEEKAAAKAEAKATAAAERAAAREAAVQAKADARASTPCECGCGGVPSGAKSRFLPGHDARHYSAQRKAEATA